MVSQHFFFLEKKRMGEGIAKRSDIGIPSIQKEVKLS